AGPGDQEAAIGKAEDVRPLLIADGLRVDLECRADLLAGRVEDLRRDPGEAAVAPERLPGDDEPAARQSGDLGMRLLSAGRGVDGEFAADMRSVGGKNLRLGRRRLEADATVGPGHDVAAIYQRSDRRLGL